MSFGRAEFKRLDIQMEMSKRYLETEVVRVERGRGGDLKLLIIGVQMLFKAMSLGMITKTVSVNREEKNIKNCALEYSVLCVYTCFVSHFV